jgi:hypothetical protein
MQNSIILSHILFGSVFLFSRSLELLNKTMSDNKKTQWKLFLINGSIFVASGTILMYSFNLGIKKLLSQSNINCK